MEPNDDYSQAWAAASETAPASGTFDISADEDWYRVDMNAGRSYTLQTSALAANVDTILELYDTDGVTRLASDDNGGGGKASRIDWQSSHDGTYFVRVSMASGSVFGCSATYGLRVEAMKQTYLPADHQTLAATLARDIDSSAVRDKLGQVLGRPIKPHLAKRET